MATNPTGTHRTFFPFPPGFTSSGRENFISHTHGKLCHQRGKDNRPNPFTLDKTFHPFAPTNAKRIGTNSVRKPSLSSSSLALALDGLTSLPTDWLEIEDYEFSGRKKTAGKAFPPGHPFQLPSAGGSFAMMAWQFCWLSAAVFFFPNFLPFPTITAIHRCSGIICP